MEHSEHSYMRDAHVVHMKRPSEILGSFSENGRPVLCLSVAMVTRSIRDPLMALFHH